MAIDMSRTTCSRLPSVSNQTGGKTLVRIWWTAIPFCLWIVWSWEEKEKGLHQEGADNRTVWRGRSCYTFFYCTAWISQHAASYIALYHMSRAARAPPQILYLSRKQQLDEMKHEENDDGQELVPFGCHLDE